MSGKFRCASRPACATRLLPRAPPQRTPPRPRRFGQMAAPPRARDSRTRDVCWKRLKNAALEGDTLSKPSCFCACTRLLPFELNRLENPRCWNAIAVANADGLHSNPFILHTTSQWRQQQQQQQQHGGRNSSNSCSCSSSSSSSSNYFVVACHEICVDRNCSVA